MTNISLDIAEELFARRDFRRLHEHCGGLLAERDRLELQQLARLEYMIGCALEGGLRLPEAQEAYMNAEQHYIDCGMERQALKARLGVTLTRRATQPIEHVYREAQRCRQLALDKGWGSEAAEALVLMATACRHMNSYSDVLELTAEAIDQLDAEQDRYLYYRATSVRAWALTSLGRIEEGDRLAHLAFDLLRGIDNPGLLRRELGHFAFQAWCKGDLKRARLLTQQQLESGMADCAGLEVAMSRYNLGLFAAQEESWSEAVKYGLLAWQQHLGPQGLVIEAGVLMLLSLCSIHLLKPEEALNYMHIARRSMRESGNDEAKLLGYYLAQAQLACGHVDLAAASWSSRRELEYSIENKIEIGWLRRVLERVCSADYDALLPDRETAHELARRMDLDLREWHSACERAISTLPQLQQVA